MRTAHRNEVERERPHVGFVDPIGTHQAEAPVVNLDAMLVDALVVVGLSERLVPVDLGVAGEVLVHEVAHIEHGSTKYGIQW